MCNSKHFWLTKFNHDELQMINLHHTIVKWINEYRFVKSAQLKTRVVMDKLLTFGVKILFNGHFKSYTEMYKRGLIVEYVAISETFVRLVCTMKEVKDMLFKMYYYEQKNNITFDTIIK